MILTQWCVAHVRQTSPLVSMWSASLVNCWTFWCLLADCMSVTFPVNCQPFSHSNIKTDKNLDFKITYIERSLLLPGGLEGFNLNWHFKKEWLHQWGWWVESATAKKSLFSMISSPVSEYWGGYVRCWGCPTCWQAPALQTHLMTQRWLLKGTVDMLLQSFYCQELEGMVTVPGTDKDVQIADIPIVTAITTDSQDIYVKPISPMQVSWIFLSNLSPYQLSYWPT